MTVRKVRAEKIVWKDGVHTINFPTMFCPPQVLKEILKLQSKYKLPKYGSIGFRYEFYEESRMGGAFDVTEIFITKPLPKKK